MKIEFPELNTSHLEREERPAWLDGKEWNIQGYELKYFIVDEFIE